MANWHDWKPVDWHGWELSESIIPDQKGETRAGPYDMFFPHDASDRAALIYAIGEIRMNTETGRLAVFEHKDNPVVIFNPNFDCFVTDDTVQWSWAGNLLFVKVYITLYPFAVIDLNRRLFSFIATGFDLSAHEMRQVDDRTFWLVDYINGNRPYRRDVRLIKLDEMKWVSLDRFDDFGTIFGAELSVGL